jgi:SAM-dependent methyltransferase
VRLAVRTCEGLCDYGRVSGQDTQPLLDASNAAFWNELCGSGLARALGVKDASVESLARFDRAYWDLYPYLAGYLPWHGSERVLEIGLGYGTVGQFLAERGLAYHGLDISPGPVEMMVHRLRLLGAGEPDARVKQGSALAIPHPDEFFDVVVSIGCLHHTGNVKRAIGEVERVLRPGGQAMVMLYNRHSYRRLLTLPAKMLREGVIRDRARRTELARAAYDANAEGTAAPATEFTSVAEARRLFGSWSQVRVRRENCEATRLFDRATMLPIVGRIAGLDLYITATK